MNVPCVQIFIFVASLLTTLSGCQRTDPSDSLATDSRPIDGTSALNSDREVNPNPPNIIFVMADDLGCQGIGCYGNLAVATPHLDRMARQGIKFSHAYTGSPVCAPARCILMTGKHAGRCSVRADTGGVPLPDADVTIAEVLQSQGYVTGGFGKWALGIEGSSGDPLNQGFDEFFGYYHQTHALDHFPEYLLHNGKRIELPGNQSARMTTSAEGFANIVNPSTGQKMSYAPYLIAKEAKKFIRRHSQDKFFCYLPLTLPDGSFQVPNSDPITEAFHEKDWSMRAKVVASMTAIADRQMGEIFALLKELQIDDETIVFFCSDHGAALRFDGELDACGEYRGEKRSVFEGGLRVPMIVRGPGRILAGRTSDMPIYLGDVFATLADLAQVETDPQRTRKLDSLSFAPTLLMNGRPQMQHEFFVWDWAVYNPSVDQWGDRMQSLRQGNWKILRHSEKDPWEFYNLASDPFERNDLSEKLPLHAAELFEIYKREVRPRPPQNEALEDWMGDFPFDEQLQRRDTNPSQ
jgi:arylsulfatase A-like enzyme